MSKNLTVVGSSALLVERYFFYSYVRSSLFILEIALLIVTLQINKEISSTIIDIHYFLSKLKLFILTFISSHLCKELYYFDIFVVKNVA